MYTNNQILRCDARIPTRCTTHRMTIDTPRAARLGVHVLLLHAEVLRMRVHGVVLFLKLLLKQVLELLLM